MADSTLISAQVSLSALDRALPGYRVIQQVGHGAMGIVFEAEQRSLARRVALKVLPPNLALRERTVKRFLREAAAMGRLGHPNIVDVYEVGSVLEFHFFSMRFVEGPPLDRALRAGALGIADVLSIGIDVAGALAHAHARGVMHRDVKPGNLLRDGDKVVLTDFGLARPLDADDGGSVTESGDLVGTPLYMAPEQISGDIGRIDGRADVWGLGVTLYELLAQQAPFTGQSASAILHAILHRDPPRITRLRPDVPRDFEAVIHKCLEKDPARRYPGAAALLEDLVAVREHRPVTARPPRFFDPLRRWIQRHPAEAGIVAGSLLVTIVLMLVANTAWTAFRGSEQEKNVKTAERDIATNERIVANALTDLARSRMAWLEARDDTQRGKIEDHILDVLAAPVLEKQPAVLAEVFELAAEFMRRRGRSTEQVLSEFEPHLAGFDPSSALLFRAALLMGMGQHEDALAAYRRRIDAYPDDPRATFEAARAQRRVGEFALDRGESGPGAAHLREALELLDCSIAMCEHAGQRELQASALVERAFCRLDLAEPDEAQRDLLRVLELDATRVDAQSSLSAAQRMAAARAQAAAARTTEAPADAPTAVPATGSDATTAGSPPKQATAPDTTDVNALSTDDAPSTPRADSASRQKTLQPIFDVFQRLMRGGQPEPAKPAPPPAGGGGGSEP